MKEISSRREELTPHLLALLERANASLALPEVGYSGALLAMFLLAEFREPRAFDPILQLLEAAEDQIDFVFGDTLTEDLPAILVSVATDLAPVVRLARNEKRHPWARSAAFSTLRVALVTGRMTREEVIGIYREILRRELSRGELASLEICESIAMDAMDLAAGELEPEIRELWEADLISLQMIDEKELFRGLGRNPDEALEELRRGRHNRLITDAVEACAWWGLFHDHHDGHDHGYGDICFEPVETIRHETPRPGRNSPCPCGSGRKYKKCCGA